MSCGGDEWGSGLDNLLFDPRHRRARKATRASGVTHRVEPKLPVDILGGYVYLPAE